MLGPTSDNYLPIGRRQYFRAVLGQPRDKDLPVGLIVIDDQDAFWTVHLERLSWGLLL
jgi:hypothetical protein